MEQVKTYKLRPITKKAIAALTRIVKGIESGKYLHKQSEWHCGSAHCIAGWHYVLAAERIARKLGSLSLQEFAQTHNLNYVEREDRNLLQKELALEAKYASDRVTAAEYSVATLGLSEQEALSLFSGNNSIDDIKEIVGKFSQGLRQVDKLDTTEGYPVYRCVWVDANLSSYRYSITDLGDWVIVD